MATSQPEHPSYGVLPRSRERWPKGAVVGLVIAFTLVLLAGSMPAIGSGATLTKVKPAYKGYSYTNWVANDTGCGAAGGYGTEAASLKTGDFVGYLGSIGSTNIGHSCDPPGVENTAYTYSDEHMDVILGHAPKTGNQQVIAYWFDGLGGYLDLQPGNASQNGFATLEYVLEPYLVDQTNGSILRPTSAVNWTLSANSTNTSGCSYYLCAYGVAQTLEFWWNSTYLNSGHTYWFETDLVGVAYARCNSSYTTATSIAATGGTKLKLITLS